MVSGSIEEGKMKADYRNWMPKGMIAGTLAGALACLALLLVFRLTGVVCGTLRTVLTVVFLVGTIVCGCLAVWMALLHRAFSYNGSRQMSRQIIEGIAEYITLPDGGRGLDVGCGSGALTIACAKRNPKAIITGIDRWGKDYASYSRQLCEDNARAEGAGNAVFMPGDAVKLEFGDETFDAVMSNYVYHNIPSKDRQAILLETLRVLKKGGTFAIHDIFSKRRYGDMQAFVKRLREMGFEQASLIDTTDGKFMSGSEALWMDLSGSALLVGKK